MQHSGGGTLAAGSSPLLGVFAHVLVQNHNHGETDHAEEHLAHLLRVSPFLLRSIDTEDSDQNEEKDSEEVDGKANHSDHPLSTTHPRRISIL